jgi:hypothetical protein
MQFIGIPSLHLNPEKEQENLRNLVRAREDALEDQQRACHRLAQFILRHGWRYPDGKNKAQGHLWIMAAIHSAEAVRGNLECLRLPPLCSALSDEV